MKLLGTVIAGGLSRRMGEADKLWIELGGETLIARATRRLAMQTGDAILNVNRPDERLSALGLPVAPDVNAEYQGPLAGILASLSWARDNRPDVTHLAAVSVDSPFFPDDLVSRLVNGIEGRSGHIAIAFCEDFPQPVFSLWPLACLGGLEHFLAETGNLKVMAFVRSRDWCRIDFEPGDPHAFFNINTPADLAIAREHVTAGAAQE
jgi:molybdopterin-guanine dinucleotide biosynthesis protein A